MNAAVTAEAQAERRARGKPFQKGNKASRGRKPTLALLGLPAGGASKENRSALAKADRLRRRRCSELHMSHGYVSAGVSGIVASAELALAASRIIYAQAFATNDPATFKLAAQLADSHRQNEIAAWELVTRESAGRRTASPIDRYRAAINADGEPTPGADTPSRAKSDVISTTTADAPATAPSSVDRADELRREVLGAS